MAPSSTNIDVAPATQDDSNLTLPSKAKAALTGETTTAANPVTKPLKYSGALDGYKSFDVTNVIGREYPEANLLDILKDDEKIRDLAITVSQRGVVFFRNQDISVEEQKTLGQKLGELTGKPASSKVCYSKCIATLDDEKELADSFLVSASSTCFAEQQARVDCRRVWQEVG
jgi:hypothetical protein